MTLAVQEFNEQLEKLAELAIVLLVGDVVVRRSVERHLVVHSAALPGAASAVRRGRHAGEPMSPRQRAMISWFGIRGIGSVFYLMFAIRHGVTGPLAQQLITFTL